MGSGQYLTGFDHFVPRYRSVAVEESLGMSEDRCDDRGWAHPVHRGTGCMDLRRELRCSLLPQRVELRAVVGYQRSVGISKWGIGIVADENCDHGAGVFFLEDQGQGFHPIDWTCQQSAVVDRIPSGLHPYLGQAVCDGTRCLVHDRIANERHSAKTRTGQGKTRPCLDHGRTRGSRVRSRGLSEASIPHQNDQGNREQQKRDADQRTISFLHGSGIPTVRNRHSRQKWSDQVHALPAHVGGRVPPDCCGQEG